MLGARRWKALTAQFGLNTLRTTIGCHVTASDEDLSFSGVNCYVVGRHIGVPANMSTSRSSTTRPSSVRGLP